ncbi:proton myo-inositol cotransporter-like [Biomphalaria glabrata]|uniref:Proton myo-inositol cotransporter-like n=1 Tax=Biomphalaria glabrata TaxID=6526 RepID=A0A9U8E1U4_BIOGL|nr:proton myo-inositol cotransporter-like [Biomphalaria glabrata]XP_055881676.1 proton myo-inositol cotransporter-like [Biomphalaria glabrata]
MFSSDEDNEFELEAEELMMSNFSEGSKLVGGSPTIKPTVSHSVNSKRIASVSFEENTDSENENTVYTYPLKPKMKNTYHVPITVTSTVYVWLLTFFAAIGGFLFGYDTGVISGAMLLLRDKFSLSSFWQELIVSVTIAAAVVSALAGGFLNDCFGRKVVTILASFVFTAGAVVLACSSNVAMLVVGRLILGLGIGFASMTIPVYIAECAPAHLRGRLVTVNTLFITGGQFIASVLDGGFSYIKPDGWRYMLGLAGVPSLIQFCGFFFLPESPRWLMRKGRESEAHTILQRLRGTSNVDDELKEIKNTLQLESLNGDGNTMLRILRTPAVRRALIVGCGLQLFQQLTGINTVMYYSATIIKMSGVSDQQTAIWLAAVTAGINFIFTIVGVWLVERIGRKKLVMGSLIGVTGSLILLAVTFQLVALMSPSNVSYHSNTTCSSYRSCDSCVDNSQCGYCYTGSGSSVNGSCLATSSIDTGHSDYGPCENATSLVGHTWASDYCPTSYSWMAILGLILYLMFFAPGMGPMPWTINSEIYPIWARSTGNSLSAATNWIANLLVSMTFLTLTETLTKYGTYWLFVGIAILGLMFFGICLPETKGRKLEDIEDLFSQPWSLHWRSSRSRYTSLKSSSSSS